MSKHKYKIGEKVVYDGLIGIVTGLCEYSWIGKEVVGYHLEAEENRELSSTVTEDEVQPYNGEEIDQESRLSEANIDSLRIRNLGESLTDKNFRDGNH